jgi:hypothetical protein
MASKICESPITLTLTLESPHTLPFSNILIQLVRLVIIIIRFSSLFVIFISSPFMFFRSKTRSGSWGYPTQPQLLATQRVVPFSSCSGMGADLIGRRPKEGK